MAEEVTETQATKAAYDASAQGYQDVSYKKDDEVEFYAFFMHCGDIAGKTVLDLACGEGRYSRMIKEKGAMHVVGLDLSEEMCKLGREHALQAKFPVEYRRHDLANPLPFEMTAGFDLVTSQYMLCYAQTKGVLMNFVQHSFDACKPGASFVSLTDNMSLTPDQYHNFDAYGFHKETDAAVGDDGLLPEGSKVTWVFPGQFTSDVWIWHPATYVAAYERAGFVDVEFFGFHVPSKYVFNKESVEYLRPRILTPPVIGIKGRRPKIYKNIFFSTW